MGTAVSNQQAVPPAEIIAPEPAENVPEELPSPMPTITDTATITPTPTQPTPTPALPAARSLYTGKSARQSDRGTGGGRRNRCGW